MEAVCRNCGYKRSIEEIHGINVAENPELKARVRDGSLFVWECPCCGQRNLARFQTLYHDPARKLMIWLLPDGAEPPAAVAEAVKALEGYTLRQVSEPGALVEKVNIFEAGLDDAVMELCKYVTAMEMAQKNPEAADAQFRFVRLEGADNDLVLAFPMGGSMQAVNIGFNVYEDARAILARNPGAAPAEGFALVDREWVNNFFR